MKFITLKLILFCLCLFVMKEVIASGPCTPDILLHDINAFRSSHGLPTLKMDARITAEAEKHTRAMAEHHIALSHDGFNIRYHRLFHQFNHASGIAENVAYHDIDDDRRFVALWFNSPGHRKNILGNYNLTGISVLHDANGRVYSTQIFMRVKNS